MTVTEDMTAVSVADLYVNSSFYTTLAERKRKGDRVVLIRMPAEVKLDSFTGTVLTNLDGESAAPLCALKVMKRRNPVFKSTNDFSFTSDSAADDESEASNFVLKRNPVEHEMCSMALTVPVNMSTRSREDTAIMEVSSDRFDEFWTLERSVIVPEVDYARIEKQVRKRASRPLVAQPEGLRLRVSAVSTPPAKKRSKSQKKSQQQH